jgi:hypothetical protein
VLGAPGREPRCDQYPEIEQNHRHHPAVVEIHGLERPHSMHMQDLSFSLYNCSQTSKGFINRFLIRKILMDIRLNQNDVGSLCTAFRILPSNAFTKIVFRKHVLVVLFFLQLFSFHTLQELLPCDPCARRGRSICAALMKNVPADSTISPVRSGFLPSPSDSRGPEPS